MQQILNIQSLAIHKPKVNPYDIFVGTIAGLYVRDRFNVLNKYSVINWADRVDPIPTKSDTSLTDIIDKRACDLIAQGSIAAQWSGGVDSTTMVLALMKNGVSKEDLVILHDSASVEEYPEFYKKFKGEGWNFKEVKSWIPTLSNIDTNVITNGWCADQLFGSVFFHTDPSVYFTPIQELIQNQSVQGVSCTADQCAELYEAIHDYGKNTFDVDLQIAAELGWFINFTCKWTWVSTFNELMLVGTKNQKKTQCFYETLPFQEWSVGNFEEIAKHNIYDPDKAEYYKRPLKEYCQEVFKDEHYFQTKTKVPSWGIRGVMQKATTYNRVVKTTEKYYIFKYPIYSASIEDPNKFIQKIAEL